MKHVVIVGAGGAGLNMLEHLLIASLDPLHISMVDPDPESYRQRTWCRWLPDHQLQPYHSVSWNRIRFAAPMCDQIHTLHESTYAYASGPDYRTHVIGLNDGMHQIDWVMQPATGFGYDGPGQAYVLMGDDRITCDWIFTSWLPGQRSDIRLWQHFHGWVIETATPVFTADTMTLMDFDVPQHPTGAVFGYVLPYEPTLALVEITSFSPSIWLREEYEQRLSDYIRARYGLEPASYTIRSTESGRIPMDTIPKPEQPNLATFPIGTIYGAVKPSTGYAFTRMQHTCRHLAETLVRDGRPSYPAPSAPRFAFYDALLLRIIRQWPEAVVPIFRSLFSRVPIDTIFRFLDEKTTLRQETGIFLRLPLTPFLKSLWKHVIS